MSNASKVCSTAVWSAVIWQPLLVVPEVGLEGDGVADDSGVADGSGGGVALLVGTGVALGLEGVVITRAEPA